MNQQPNDQQLIEQVLNQAVKGGLFANLESVAVIWRAWNTIKYKLEQQDAGTNDHNNS